MTHVNICCKDNEIVIADRAGKTGEVKDLPHVATNELRHKAGA